jgi:hypothetical protein
VRTAGLPTVWELMAEPLRGEAEHAEIRAALDARAS